MGIFWVGKSYLLHSKTIPLTPRWLTIFAFGVKIDTTKPRVAEKGIDT